jgi:hypothetical protein
VPPFGPLGGVLARGDVNTSIGFWRDRLRSKPTQLRANLLLARLLHEVSRDSEALPHWAAVLNADPSHFEAAFQLAAASIAAGETLDAALAALPAEAAKYADAITRLLEEPPKRVARNRRHIAIAGVSYCGSTILDRILGGLPGCGSIGESHWLVDLRLPGVKATIDPADPDAPGFVPCATCGPGCAAISFDFRVALLADRRQWYDRIAERLGVETLISSDKNLTKLLENDPLLRFDAIVLFKSPQQAWKSQAANTRVADHDRTASLRHYLDSWRDRHSNFLRDFQPSGRVVFLNFDAFASDPARFLPLLCDRLGLTYDPRVLTTYVPGHALAGNLRVREQLGSSSTMEIRALSDHGLSEDEQTHIRNDAATLEIYEQLMRRHREAFE